MLARRSLVWAQQVLDEPIVRRETLQDVRRASECLQQARREAEAILDAAEQESRQRVDAAQAAFWQQANSFLDALRQEQMALERASLEAVERLLNLALARVLDDTTLPERIRALLKNLADSQGTDSSASLICHPDNIDALRSWLAASRFSAVWKVEGDAGLAPDAIRLSHEQGAFDLDWTGLRQALLAGAPVSDATA
ncbi:type III secretion system stator protein SctL [Pseudomonas sp. LRF_L74]|uniref:type III secretion system stator protein SctL n=1 Tax=Pseudomonas sp. LRF_L74 TaxID=3369422 RepID=UPI003F5DA8E5